MAASVHGARVCARGHGIYTGALARGFGSRARVDLLFFLRDGRWRGTDRVECRAASCFDADGVMWCLSRGHKRVVRSPSRRASGIQSACKVDQRSSYVGERVIVSGYWFCQYDQRQYMEVGPRATGPHSARGAGGWTLG